MAAAGGPSCRRMGTAVTYAVAVTAQKQGRALTAHLLQCRALRGRAGFGRCSRRGAVCKLG